MRILLIEDDRLIVCSLIKMLKEANFAVDSAEQGEQGYFLAATNPYDAIILDYNLPDITGREIVKRLRTENINTPILMLTVKSEVDDKVDVLSLGADDYLTKPFVLSELLARIRAIIRRPATYQSPSLNCGELTMVPDQYKVCLGKKDIKLSSKEFSLLEYLLTNQGRILSRREIIEHVWDENANPFSNIIEVHIKNIRKKLGRGRKMIITQAGRGYKLEANKTTPGA